MLDLMQDLELKMLMVKQPSKLQKEESLKRAVHVYSLSIHTQEGLSDVQQGTNGTSLGPRLAVCTKNRNAKTMWLKRGEKRGDPPTTGRDYAHDHSRW